MHLLNDNKLMGNPTLNNCTPITANINCRRQVTNTMFPIVFTATITHWTTCYTTQYILNTFAIHNPHFKSSHVILSLDTTLWSFLYLFLPRIQLTLHSSIAQSPQSNLAEILLLKIMIWFNISWNQLSKTCKSCPQIKFNSLMPLRELILT